MFRERLPTSARSSNVSAALGWGLVKVPRVRLMPVSVAYCRRPHLKVESAVDSVSVAPVALAATLRLSVAVDASCTACVTQYGPYHSVGATTI